MTWREREKWRVNQLHPSTARIYTLLLSHFSSHIYFSLKAKLDKKKIKHVKAGKDLTKDNNSSMQH